MKSEEEWDVLQGAQNKKNEKKLRKRLSKYLIISKGLIKL